MKTEQTYLYSLINYAEDSAERKSLRWRAPQSLLGNLFDLDVQELGFSAAVARVMRDANVSTVGELVRQTERVLLQWRGLGPRRIGEIKDRLQILGLSLGIDPDGMHVQSIVEVLALPIAQRPLALASAAAYHGCEKGWTEREPKAS